jgi:RHS repeat-associated protein
MGTESEAMSQAQGTDSRTLRPTLTSYYRARYYDASAGRLLSEDPLAFGGGMNFYVYVHGSPINLVDPFGLQDNASPWQVGWEWFTGTGPRTHHFSDGDRFTEMLRQHQHVQDLINEVCNGTLPPQGRFNYDLSGPGGVPKYLKDYSTLFTGGLTGNLAVTYLGSYGLSYSESNGTLNIHVWNVSSIGSATHPPVIGYTNWWNNNIGNPLNNFFSSGPMSATTQTFDFHENLANRGCGCHGAN